MTAFDRPPAGRTHDGANRLIGLDVARAVTLFGVVMMNYHGMLSYPNQVEFPGSFIERIFDIRSGVLSTRFAAAFVVVAGIGVTLLTNSARFERTSRIETRLRLVRRGTILLLVGYFLDMAWPGTILFYYGVFFVITAFIFHLPTIHLVAIGTANAAVTLAVSTWRRSRLLEGDGTAWISPSSIESLQDFLTRTFVGYTHPILPWMTFLIAGMICGRHLDQFRARVRPISAILIAVIVVSYLATSIVRSVGVDSHALAYILTSMQPDERGLAYIVSTMSLALLAISVIFLWAEKARDRGVVILQRAGQLSLTLYLGHVLFYYIFAEWTGWITGTGVASSLTLAIFYWLFAIAAGSWWHRRVGQGPAEVLYRRLGG